jgi:hypothetical protein
MVGTFPDDVRKTLGVQKADQYMQQSGNKQGSPDYSWASVYMGACAVLWQETNESKYEAKLAYFANSQVNALNGVEHTPAGLTYLSQWGPLRHAVGGAGILGIYALGLKKSNAVSSLGQNPEEIAAFAESQVRE